MAYRNAGGNDYYIGDEYTARVNGHDVTMYAYFPKGMRAGDNINTRIYWPGLGGYQGNYHQYRPISDYYTDNDNVDYVMLAFDRDREYGDISQQAIDEVIRQIEAEKGVDLSINSVCGLSAGGNDLVSNTLNVLRNDPSAQQQRMLLYDPFSDDYGFWYNLSEEDIRLMQQNETESVFFLPTNRGTTYRNPNTNEGKFVNALAANGMSVVLIDGGFVHGQSTSNALYNGWMDFLNGYGDLEDISLANYNYSDGTYGVDLGYQISIPNVDSNGSVTWLTYKLSDLINAKQHPENYTSEELASLNFATEYLYDVVQVEDADALKKRAQRLLSSFSALLEVAPPECVSSGSSALIPGENAALKKVQSAMMAVRDSFEKEINMLLYAEDEYLNMEAELTKNTNELNNMFKDSLDDLKIAPVALEVNLEEPKKEEPKKTETTGTRVSTGGGSYGGGGYSQPSSSNSQEAEIQELPNTQDDKNEEKPVSEVVNNAPKQETVVPQNVNVTSDSGSHSTVTVSRASTPVVEQTQEESMTDLYEEDYDDTYDAETPSYNSQQPKEQYIEPQIQTNTQVSTQTVNRNKGNNTLKTVGILAAAGAVTAAGAYAGKKYLDKKKEEDGEFDYDDDTPSSNDEI